MADTSDAPTHKGHKSKNKTLLVHFGISIVEARKPTEQRELCGHGQVRGEAGRGARRGLGTTVAITAILFHRLSFIKPDKLLKEPLSDCCWYAARKQPSMSVS